MAVLNKQGIVEIRRRRDVRFWAWLVSLSIHIILLAAFCVIKFSRPNHPPSQTVSSVPIARIVQAAASMQTSIMPKPKITEPVTKRLVKSPQPKLSAQNVFTSSMPVNQQSAESGQVYESIKDSNEVSVMPGEVEFFGNRSNKRKICYVVDCSGSMKGLIGRVQRELKDSIAALEPDQFFSIIFFGDGRLLEFDGGSLVRATAKTKASAAAFVDSIRPAGVTNAMKALERAVRLGDSGGESPTVIYFLTDGFELGSEERYLFCLRVTELLKRFAPAASIHTVGFWPSNDDRRMLEMIAQQTGGNFVFVSDGDN